MSKLIRQIISIMDSLALALKFLRHADAEMTNIKTTNNVQFVLKCKFKKYMLTRNKRRL